MAVTLVSATDNVVGVTLVQCIANGRLQKQTAGIAAYETSVPPTVYDVSNYKSLNIHYRAHGTDFDAIGKTCTFQVLHSADNSSWSVLSECSLLTGNDDYTKQDLKMVANCGKYIKIHQKDGTNQGAGYLYSVYVTLKK
jgi:hypothetical protein